MSLECGTQNLKQKKNFTIKYLTRKLELTLTLT